MKNIRVTVGEERVVEMPHETIKGEWREIGRHAKEEEALAMAVETLYEFTVRLTKEVNRLQGLLVAVEEIGRKGWEETPFDKEVSEA